MLSDLTLLCFGAATVVDGASDGVDVVDAIVEDGDIGTVEDCDGKDVAAIDVAANEDDDDDDDDDKDIDDVNDADADVDNDVDDGNNGTVDDCDDDDDDDDDRPAGKFCLQLSLWHFIVHSPAWQFSLQLPT